MYKKLFLVMYLCLSFIFVSCNDSETPTGVNDSSSSELNSSSNDSNSSSSDLNSSSSQNQSGGDVPFEGVPLVALQSEVSSFFGTQAVKLVYSWNDYLYLVDYSGDEVSSIKLKHTSEAILPMISPDGKWLLFAKGPKGDLVNNLDMKSSAYIMELGDADAQPIEIVTDNAFEPRFVMTSDKLEIVYATKGVWGSWAGVGETRIAEYDTTTQSLENDRVLISSGAYVAGYNGEYAASAGNNAILKNVTNDTPFDTVYQISLFDASNVETTGERQVCNGSIIPSLVNPGNMIGLDFGSSGKTNPDINDGIRWWIHSILFVFSSDKKVIRDIMVPNSDEVSGMITSDDSFTGYSWDDSEWSNHPYFASSGLAVTRSWEDSDGNWIESVVGSEIFENAYGIDLRDGSMIQLATTPDKTQAGSSNLKWPMIWIEKAGDFSEASGWL